MSTVTAKLEAASGIGELLVDQLTAPVRFTQAARELVGKGVTVFVEVGPGNVLCGFVKRIDRSVKTISVNDLDVAPTSSRETLCLTSPRSRARRRSSPARRRGSAGRSRRSWRPPARPSSSATAPARTRPRRSRPSSAAARSRPTSRAPRRRSGSSRRPATLDILVNNAGLTRDGLLARMSDDDWRTVLETNLARSSTPAAR